MSKIKSFIGRRREPILFLLILLAAMAVRLVMFGSHPAGLNQDEASIGYDAWSLLHYGIDRKGYTLPVQLVAWGSGQNVLYAYLSMPFIALFGLNVFSVRIVNLLFSLVTVVAVYFVVRRWKGIKTGFIAMALVAAAPWNIMLARWGLESNLFPAMFTLAIWMLLKAIDKPRFLYLAAVILALSLYSYGSAYLVITLFSLACFIYFIVKKRVPLRQLIFGALIYIVLSIPIYLFMIVNVFGLDGIQLGVLSIPRLYGNRIEAQSGTTAFGFFSNFYKNVIEQTDKYFRNAIAFYGCFYVISLPFWLFGVYKCIRSHDSFDFIVLSALVSSLLLFCYYNDPNINRVNAVYMPLILLTAVGLGDFAESKRRLAAVAAAYLMSFAGFCVRYFREDYRTAIANEFFVGLGEAIEAADELSQGTQTVHITHNVNMPYIYTLFYTQTPPDEFIATVHYTNPGSMFEDVASFCNYSFNTDGAANGESGIYIMENSSMNEVASKTSDIRSYGNYIVAVIH